MPYQPNRTAAQIVQRLVRDGFTVKVPDEPHRSIYTLVLDRGLHFGTLHISAAKGRALRISITWQLTNKTRKAEGARAIIGLLNNLPKEG
ncbi:hypothetical protein [Streptosporangium sp. NPDC001681]|uniref:hypothetical protein n=1 Tax=Streptosporangium sp. NPDC001681 TaxID=3154395 RepID=UPI0033224531